MTRGTRTGGRPARPITEAELVLEGSESLLDVVDNVLNQGVVLTGDLTIGLAQVDLIYARLSVLLCAADRVLPEGRTSANQSTGSTVARRRPSAPRAAAGRRRHRR